MNLKRMPYWLLLSLFFSTVAPAQQATKADVQALEVGVSNLETTVKEMDKRLTAQIQAVEVKVDEMDKRLTNKVEELDKRVTAQIQAVVAC